MTTSEIGQNIKQKRKEKGLTQAQLGELTGVVGTSIQQIEAGRRNPSKKLAARIADVLDMPVTDLIVSPPSQAEHLANQVQAITTALTDKKSKRALTRMGIVEDLFLLSDDELSAVSLYITDLMKRNGGIRHYEKIYNADAKADPNATYSAPDDD